MTFKSQNILLSNMWQAQGGSQTFTWVGSLGGPVCVAIQVHHGVLNKV